MKKHLSILSVAFAVLFPMILSAREIPVYFGTSQSKGIYRALFNSDSGKLSESRLVAELERPGFIAIHPNRKYLYSTTVDGSDPQMGGVAAFEIQIDGGLKLLNQQSSQGRGACHVSVDQIGKCVLVSNYGSGSVAALEIKSDGSLAPSRSFHQHEGSADHPKRQAGPHAHSAYTSPDNNYAYVCDLGTDEVVIYALDNVKAELTPSGSVNIPGAAMGPRHMKWLHDNRYAYILNELDLSISIYKAVDNGQLEFIKSYSTLSEGADKGSMSAAEIRIHPGGRYICSSNRDLAEEGRDSIAVFKFHDGGATLEQVEVQTVPVSIPRNFNFDPSGDWMLVGGQRSNDIAILPFDQRVGHLRTIKEKVSFDGGPICIQFLD